jgi:hypothetical protein
VEKRANVVLIALIAAVKRASHKSRITPIAQRIRSLSLLCYITQIGGILNNFNSNNPIHGRSTFSIVRLIRIIRLLHLLFILSLRLNQLLTPLFQRLAITARDTRAVRIMSRYGRRVRRARIRIARIRIRSTRRRCAIRSWRRSSRGSSVSRRGRFVVVFGCLGVNIPYLGGVAGAHTQFMSNPSTSGHAADSRSSKHGSRMSALVLLFLFLICRGA